MEQIYLSRRNLLILLSKLDRQKEGQPTACTIVKCDALHPMYPQTMGQCQVTAIEDEAYYIDRAAGEMFPKDERRVYEEVLRNEC